MAERLRKSRKTALNKMVGRISGDEEDRYGQNMTEYELLVVVVDIKSEPPLQEAE